MAPLYFVPRSPLRAEPRFSVLEAAEFSWARQSSHKSMRAYIVYCCLTKGLRVSRHTIKAYQMCLDIFPQVDLNAATEINWNLHGE